MSVSGGQHKRHRSQQFLRHHGMKRHSNDNHLGVTFSGEATGIVALVVAVLTTALIQGALSGIYLAAPYRFATKDEDTGGFDSDVLRLAFRPK